MFGFGNDSYYDTLREVYGEEEAFARYESKHGKLFIGTANNDGDTRLFVRSVNPLTDMRKKSGWWNTFTITNRPCDAGTFICKVIEVRADKNGYPIFVATPVVRIDENIIACDEVMYLFGLSGMFVEELHGWNSEYNHAYFEEQINAISFVPVSHDINHHIAIVQEAVRLFVNGTICREQVVAWLHEPTDFQKQEAAFEEEVMSFFDKADFSAFPLLGEKYLKMKGTQSYIWPEKKVTFTQDLVSKYEVAVANGHIAAMSDASIWQQIEAYLVFDNERKKVNKAAKTAAKKAKKAAAN